MAAKDKKSDETALVTLDLIERNIYVVREQNVMLDSDLAKLYGVATKVFNQAVGRNLQRFPDDFRFQLTTEEFENLRSQFVTSSSKTMAADVICRMFLPNKAWRCCRAF